MEERSYEYRDYELHKCIGCIDKWFQNMLPQLARGNAVVTEIHISKVPANIYFPERWSLIIKYLEK